MADIPTPRPLTAEQVADVKAYYEDHGESPVSEVLRLVATVEQLQAEVGRWRREAEKWKARAELNPVEMGLNDPTELGDRLRYLSTHIDVFEAGKELSDIAAEVDRLTANLATTTSDLAAITEAAVVLSNAVYASEYRDARRAADVLDRALARAAQPQERT